MLTAKGKANSLIASQLVPFALIPSIRSIARWRTIGSRFTTRRGESKGLSSERHLPCSGGSISSGISGQVSPSADEKMLRLLEKVTPSCNTRRWSSARTTIHAPSPLRVMLSE